MKNYDLFIYILLFIYFRKEESGREGKDQILPIVIQVNLKNINLMVLNNAFITETPQSHSNHAVHNEV
jgi:hypothetical protein